MTLEERARLREYKEKIQPVIFGAGIGIPLFILVLSFIPMGFIPHRSAARVSDGSQSLADMLGILPTILLVFGIGALIMFFLMNSYNYFKLLKDIDEKEKIKFQVKVGRVLYKSGAGPQEIEVFFRPAIKNKFSVEFIAFRNFPKIKKGDEVEIEATSNALYPLSIKKLGGSQNITDIQSALDLLNQLKDKK